MLNVCIIGCGARGKGHAKVWNERDDARVVAVCDVLKDRVQALAEETGAAPYTDWQEAVMHEGVEVVSQCVPSYLHADVTCFAAENGRHVFGEKPLALTVEQGERMLRTVEQNEVVFMPCFQNRDRGNNIKYREIFQSGKFGGPITFRFTDIREVRPKTAMHDPAQNGGPVIDMACHFFDLMRWITGTEPVRVSASGHVFGKGKERLSELKDLAIDEAAIEVSMEGGHQLQMYINWGMPENFPKVSGEQWMVGPELAVRPNGDGVEVLYADHTERWPGGVNPGISMRLERFVQAINGDTAPDITGEDGLIALKLSHLALASMDKGETLVFEG